jgi:hypothetical protein
MHLCQFHLLCNEQKKIQYHLLYFLPVQWSLPILGLLVHLSPFPTLVNSQLINFKPTLNAQDFKRTIT